MTEMSNLIADAVARKLTPEFIEQEIDTRVGKLVVEAVDKALRSWSDTGKLIETAIENSLRVDRLDLPSYGSTVTAMLKAQIEARVSDLVAGRLAEDMDELLKLAPKSVKLSEIAAEMIRGRDGYGEVITVIVKHTEYGSTWLCLDENEAYEERHDHRCAVRLLIDKGGKIASATLDDRDINTTKVLGNRYGLAQKVRAYYAAGTIIEIDEHSVVTSIGDY